MHVAAVVIGAILLGVAVIAFILTAFSDPGFLPRRDHLPDIDATVEDERAKFEEAGLARALCGTFACLRLHDQWQDGHCRAFPALCSRGRRVKRGG